MDFCSICRCELSDSLTHSNCGLNIIEYSGPGPEPLFLEQPMLTLEYDPSNIIKFMGKDSDTPILQLDGNGDIFVKGKLIENDKEVVDALRKFIGVWSA